MTLPSNGFQDRPVVTTSVTLRMKLSPIFISQRSLAVKINGKGKERLIERAEAKCIHLEQAERVSLLLERAEVVGRKLKQTEGEQIGQGNGDRWDRRSGTDGTDEAGQTRRTKRGR